MSCKPLSDYGMSEKKVNGFVLMMTHGLVKAEVMPDNSCSIVMVDVIYHEVKVLPIENFVPTF